MLDSDDRDVTLLLRSGCEYCSMYLVFFGRDTFILYFPLFEVSWPVFFFFILLTLKNICTCTLGDVDTVWYASIEVYINATGE